MPEIADTNKTNYTVTENKRAEMGLEAVIDNRTHPQICSYEKTKVSTYKKSRVDVQWRP